MHYAPYPFSTANRTASVSAPKWQNPGKCSRRQGYEVSICKHYGVRIDINSPPRTLHILYLPSQLYHYYHHHHQHLQYHRQKCSSSKPSQFSPWLPPVSPPLFPASTLTAILTSLHALLAWVRMGASKKYESFNSIFGRNKLT